MKTRRPIAKANSPDSQIPRLRRELFSGILPHGFVQHTFSLMSGLKPPSLAGLLASCSVTAMRQPTLPVSHPLDIGLVWLLDDLYLDL